MILVPVGEFPEWLLARLSRRTRIPLGPPRVDPAVAWNPGRGQYDSNRLLAELKAHYDGVVIGATACDLFIPVLTFVFGEAEMRGRAAIFSIHRLREEFYGLPENARLLESRALRELLHELGHLRGLAHCQDWCCIMSSAHSVERVDTRGDKFCHDCRLKLEAAGAAHGVPA
ncbi:MAG TPA: archaemetzincin [Bryobacteraceae bacterium]|nr:archaemetzincin [Bryobacteraceae bacterium]